MHGRCINLHAHLKKEKMEGGWLEINVNEAAVIGIVLIDWISFFIFFLDALNMT